MGFNDVDNNDILKVPITENEITLAIRALKSGKSAGLHGIINEYITNTAHMLINFILNSSIQSLKPVFYPTVGS